MLYIAADHAGYNMKEFIRTRMAERGVAFEDFGTFSTEQDDYPAVANRLAKEVLKNNGTGILICGSGVGMSIAANRHKGIRAALLWGRAVARRSREEEDANVACLPARLVTNEEAWEIASTFLSTTFSHLDRYKRRVKQLDA